MSVVLNTTVPSSQLKKKHNAIAYHRVREAIAANIIAFRHVTTDRNFADILTKPVKPHLFRALCSRALFRRPPFATLPSDTDHPLSSVPVPAPPPSDTMPVVPPVDADDLHPFLPAADNPPLDTFLPAADTPSPNTISPPSHPPARL
jgi:hypothetical protein